MINVCATVPDYNFNSLNTEKTYKMQNFNGFVDGESSKELERKDFFMQKNFNNAVVRENEIFFKKYHKRLSDEQLSVLEKIRYAINNTNVIMSFCEDQIMTVFDLNNNRFFVDFIFGESKACVGLIKNNEYSFQQIELDKLNNFVENA